MQFSFSMPVASTMGSCQKNTTLDVLDPTWRCIWVCRFRFYKQLLCKHVFVHHTLPAEKCRRLCSAPWGRLCSAPSKSGESPHVQQTDPKKAWHGIRKICIQVHSWLDLIHSTTFVHVGPSLRWVWMESSYTGGLIYQPSTLRSLDRSPNSVLFGFSRLQPLAKDCNPSSWASYK